MAFKGGVVLGTVDFNATGSGTTAIGATSNTGTIDIGNATSGAFNINGGALGIGVTVPVNSDITLTASGTGRVNVSYLTQFTLPIIGASGALDDLADGLGASGTVLTSNGAGAEPTWQANASGNVSGPGSSTDNAIARWDGVTGLAIQDSAVIISDSGDVTLNSGLINIPATTSTVGQIVISSNRVVHFFGTGSTFIGSNSGNFTLSGTNNSGFGLNTGNALTSANNCTFIGKNAGRLVTSGNQNTFLGSNSGTSVNTGAQNTFLGEDTALNLVSGSNNVFIGVNVGTNYTGAESNNILIGSNVVGTLGESNIMRVDGGIAKVFIAGIRGVTTDIADAVAVLIDSAGQLGQTSSSERYKQNIQDLGSDSEIIYSLRPVKFNYKKHPDVPAWGLIAEEVDKIFPQLAVYDPETKEPDSVKYHEISILLLNEIQKLNKRLTELESRFSSSDSL